RSGPPAPPEPAPGREWFTKAEVAELLGVKRPAVTALVARHRLGAKGNGKARRYPRATVEALLALRPRGVSVRTSNFYLGAVKQFVRWMVRDGRRAANPLAHLSESHARQERRRARRPLGSGELRSLFRAALRSRQEFRGLSGC